VAAGWLGAVVLAVLAGLGAITVIGAGLTSSGSDQPRSAAEVRRQLAALPASSAPVPPATPSRPPSSSPAPSPSVVSKSFPTRGGTVVAACGAGGATIRSMSPAPGFSVHERAGAEGEFRSNRDNHDRVRVAVTCDGSTPVLALRGGGGDD
jgi:hypothetical protein